MSETANIWIADEPLPLEFGGELNPLQLAYNTWGTPNERCTNAILIEHGLTANSDAREWWGPFIGDGKLLDTARFFVICINTLASPYGSTSPLTYQRNGSTATDFPKVTVRDIVHAQKRLLDHLGVNRLQTVIGPSLGGMLALEWPLLYPEFTQTIISLGSTARHTAWHIGLSATQREAIISDPAWRGGHYGDEQPRQGLALARKIAMISYRSAQSFEQRFDRKLQDGHKEYFAVESYLDYQGDKLVDRFDANCYLALTDIMDTHNVGRGRGGHIQALHQITCPALIISITSDVLYPRYEQQELVDHIPHAEYTLIDSEKGHDAFLIEFDQISEKVTPFIEKYLQST